MEKIGCRWIHDCRTWIFLCFCVFFCIFTPSGGCKKMVESVLVDFGSSRKWWNVYSLTSQARKMLLMHERSRGTKQGCDLDRAGLALGRRRKKRHRRQSTRLVAPEPPPWPLRVNCLVTLKWKISTEGSVGSQTYPAPLAAFLWGRPAYDEWIAGFLRSGAGDTRGGDVYVGNVGSENAQRFYSYLATCVIRSGDTETLFGLRAYRHGNAPRRLTVCSGYCITRGLRGWMISFSFLAWEN